jgi:hypothetical protein
VAAAGDRTKALQTNSQTKHSRAFRIWGEFLLSLGLEPDRDPYLDTFEPPQRVRIIGAFAHAVRNADFNRNRTTPLASTTVRDTLSALSAAFTSADRPDPLLTVHGKTHRLLHLQIQAYRRDDPNITHQRALPLDFILAMFHAQGNPVDRCLGPLLILAFFFAMRSCEYLQVHGDRKTELLRIHDIRFFRNKADITSSTTDLRLADFICITFRQQKNGVKNETITMSRTNDPILCPVLQAAHIVLKILALPGASSITPINTYQSGHQLYNLTASTALTRLRLRATQLGHTNLGFTADEIGLHSIRTSAAMAMVLSGTPVFMVMLIGRWKSDAFLVYIRKQIAEFTSSVASNMITVTTFFQPPDATPRQAPFTSRLTLAGREAQAQASITTIRRNGAPTRVIGAA